MKPSEVVWRKAVDSNTESSDCNMIPLRLLVTQAGDTCTGCSWEKNALRNRNCFSLLFFLLSRLVCVFLSETLRVLERQPTTGFSLLPHGMIIPLFCLNTSENLKISLPFTPLGSPHLSLSSLICLIALMVDQKKISHCQRNHPSLSQSNYKPGYFLPSAKHIADWYCMTSFSYLFYPKITEESTLILQWNCLGNFSKTSPLKLSLWKNHPLIAVWN